MVAAVLHFDKGTGAFGEAGDQVRRRLAHRHDVGDQDFSARSSSIVTPAKAGVQLFFAELSKISWIPAFAGMTGKVE